MKLKDQIKKSREIKDSSLNTYLSALRKLKHKIDGGEKPTELLNANFLHDYKNVTKAIKAENKITSKKNKLTAVLVALNSETPVNTLFNEVKHRKIPSKTKEDKLSNKEFDILQQYLILRTYLAFPIRNDFADMKVMTLKDYKKLSKKIQEDNNYLILLSNNKKQFYINQFKNKDRIGKKTLDVPSKLNRVINLWLKHNDSGWYLVKNDRETPMNPNGITKYLNKIFLKHTQKKISSSMIRHIVISHITQNDKTIKEKEEKEKEIEDTFLHSGNVNELYRKIDKKVGSDIEEPTE